MASRQPETRDSAGVEIIHNVVDSAALPTWRLANSPVMEVGRGTQQAPAEFAFVEDALRLSNGTLVVADVQAREISFFPSDGSPRRVVGGGGEGPGEFRSLVWLRRFSHDSLVAWDGLQRRATVFSPSGDLVRTVAPNHPLSTVDDREARTWRLSSFIPAAQGGWLSVATSLTSIDGTVGVPAYTVDSMRILSHQENGSIQGVLATAPWRITTHHSGRNFPAAGATRASALVGPESFIIGDLVTSQIRVFTQGGNLTRVIRFARTYSSADYWNVRTPESVDDFIERSLDNARRNAGQRAQTSEGDVRAMFDPPYLRAEPPTYAGVATDAAGRIWVEEFRPSNQPDRWIVFDTAGIALAYVEIPSALDVTDRNADHVVAVRRDHLDAQSVGVWRIVRDQ